MIDLLVNSKHLKPIAMKAQKAKTKKEIEKLVPGAAAAYEISQMYRRMLDFRGFIKRYQYVCNVENEKGTVEKIKNRMDAMMEKAGFSNISHAMKIHQQANKIRRS